MERVRLHGSIQDRRDWVPGHNDLFPAKSLLSLLTGETSSPWFIFHDHIQKTHAPKKVQVFCWLVALEKLNTHYLLQ